MAATMLISLDAASQQRVDLKLPAAKGPADQVGKGFMFTGMFIAGMSAAVLTGDKNPSLPMFALGMATHTTGMVVYTMNKKRR